MAIKEYKIKVDNEIVGLEQIEAETTPAQTEDKLKKESKKGDSVGKLVAIQMGKQAAQYAINNYGNLTGDYVTQENIGGALEVAGLIGMMATGPLGIAAAAASVGVKVASRAIDVRKSQIQSDAFRSRVGLTNGGSR